MEPFDRTRHWEKIYRTKNLEEVSWYQRDPATSLGFIDAFAVPLDARIIDVGGGDSFFVDRLLDRGYRRVTVLDISAAAIERARRRLGDRADAVNWIVADAADFRPPEQYDFWHDRAAFHFLTDEGDIENYLASARAGLAPGGVLVIGTFSEQGPEKCSGIRIRQYSEASMARRLEEHFEKIRCITVDHQTPFDTVQNFVFCSFRRP
ncbi:SAM-dependent methyltransferase [Lewinella marina]|uniref:SAM-dependent methyltransferase n=1 Tax=Neolewinella marina TaxID=438751 RepID=A0A2G0CKG7_9BACT|nr:class I SAM-dependent methyltransferase [Neolewinella marina]NJB84363.1 SAM-dependent methyltransferase [Neolewinella marina]PHL00438.1 SAM-dependent methyltransferase [Neolewinella marina]